MGLRTLFALRLRRKAARQGVPARKKRRAAPRRSAAPYAESRVGPLLATFAAAVVWFAAAASILYQRNYPSYDYVVGQTVDRDIYSEVWFEYVDLRQTDLLREQAARQVPLVYRIDNEPFDAANQTLARIRDAISAALSQPDDQAAPAPPLTSNPPRVQAVLTQLEAQGHLDALKRVFASQEKGEKLAEVVKQTLIQGIAAEDTETTFFAGMTTGDTVCFIDSSSRRMDRTVGDFLPPGKAARKVLDEFAQTFQCTPEERAALEVLVALTIEPNLVYDVKSTTALREEAAASVDLVTRAVEPGLRLLQRGDVVTPENMVLLKTHAQELLHQRRRNEGLRDSALFSMMNLVLVCVGAYGLALINPKAMAVKSSLAAVTSIAVLQIVASRVVIDLYNMQYGSSLFLFALLPLALGAILVSQLVGLRVAIWFGFFTSLIAALQNDGSLQLFVAGAVSSFVGAVLVRRACRRYHLFRAGLGVAASVFLVNAVFSLSSQVPPGLLLKVAVLALINGLGTATLASTILPLFEFLFRLTTDISLLELSDLNHPLLKRLQIEAPGTYHHSLMVATLAEQAAAAIGANPLLARVCAYFHDIGKLSYPQYFTENLAMAGRSRHDNLQPRMSSLVIVNHVKRGLELAAKYKLNKVIREAIAQHHGTSLVYYFYRRAVDKNAEAGAAKPDQPVGQDDYRYPGPLPVRREIVLIGVADSCEAATRSLEKPTPQKIESLVEEIVSKRILDGQLANADLTFQELAIAKQTIAKALVTMQHGRVAYPKETEDAGSSQDESPKTPAEG